MDSRNGSVSEHLNRWQSADLFPERPVLSGKSPNSVPSEALIGNLSSPTLPKIALMRYKIYRYT
jgi:hypothetical protein